MRRRAVALATVAAATLAVALAAGCASGSADGGNVVTPTPTPFMPTGCQIVWFSDAGAGALVNAWLVQMPVSEWTTGSHVFGTGANDALGSLYYHLDPTFETAEAIGRVTTGSFSLDVAGLAAGDPVAFADTGAEPIFDVLSGAPGAVVGTRQNGTFTGVWSDPSPDVPATPGSGSFSVFFDGSSLTLGTKTSYAVCYDENGFTQSRPGLSLRRGPEVESGAAHTGGSR